MIRVVIDTNILVSALLQPESLPAAVLMLALSGQVQLCLSEAVFAEYDEVLRRPRLKRPPDVVEEPSQRFESWGIGSNQRFQSTSAVIRTTTPFWSAPKLPMLTTWLPATSATFPSDGRRHV
ncbi:MAG: putative toxin-antitoxin system toxin component, PIN family [Acidobacteriia bacterium]|nr:putative toxin-antitoxin system toxin component, PIN family [Terriglobia bacterium]